MWVAPRSPPTSRCARRRSDPLRWVEYREPPLRLVENELDDALQASATQLEYDARYEEVQARLARAAAGELCSPAELLPIRTNPEVWELRWDFSGQLLRLYFAEPGRFPSLLVSLRYHWKWIEGSYREIEAAQDVEIGIAVSRYGRWFADPAGHS